MGTFSPKIPSLLGQFWDFWRVLLGLVLIHFPMSSRPECGSFGTFSNKNLSYFSKNSCFLLHFGMWNEGMFGYVYPEESFFFEAVLGAL